MSVIKAQPALYHDVVKLLQPWEPEGFNWQNNETGERIFAVSLTHLIASMRDGSRGTRRWSNVSHLREADFEAAGFRVIRQSAYRDTPPSPWTENRGYRKQRLGKGQTIIALKA